MRFLEIFETARERLAANDSQLNDSISTSSWTKYVNEAYNSFLLDWQVNAPREAKVESFDRTWPTGEQTFTLPNDIKDSIFYQIIQVNPDGIPSNEFPGYFETRNTLRVSPGYTTFNMSLRFYYLPVAEKWEGPDADPDSEPVFIPDRHCYALIWKTLLHVKMIYDKEIPPTWANEFEKARFLFFKEQMSRPIAKIARIRLPDAPMLRPLI